MDNMNNTSSSGMDNMSSGGHSSGMMPMPMMMYMSFYNTNNLTLLWKQLDSKKKTGTYIALLLLVACLCVLMEVLGHFRFKSRFRI